MQVIYFLSLIYYNQFAICQCNIVDFHTKNNELSWFEFYLSNMKFLHL